MAKYANPEPRGQSFRETRWRDSLRLRLPAHALHLATVGVSTSGGSAYRLAAAILRLRIPIGIGLISISLFMALGVTKVRIATSFTDFFPTAHPNVMLYEEFRAKFGGAQSVTIAIHVKQGDIFQLPTLKKIQNINTRVDALPGVNHVSLVSLASYRISYVEPVPGGLITSPFMYPNLPQNEADLAKLKHLVTIYQPTSLSSLVSSDYRTALVTSTFNEETLDYRKLFDQVRQIVADNQDANHEIWIGGEPITRGYGYSYLPSIAVCFAAAVAAMIVLLYLSLGHRSRWWAPIVTGSLSALWGLGFVGWMGYSFDPVMLVIPFLLTARDLSHGIQWQGRYYNELDRCGDKYEAIIATTSYMLPPGFLSIVADIAGILFVSLGGIPILNHLGLTAAVWLASSLWMVFVFEPIFLSFSPVPRITGRSFGDRLGEQLPGSAVGIFNRVVRIAVMPGPLRGAMLASCRRLYNSRSHGRPESQDRIRVSRDASL